MKKLLALLSLTAFLAVSVNAQTTQEANPAAKKETVAKSDSKAPAACCMKANPSCCKNNKDSKACTPEQRAECAKAGASKEHAEKGSHAGCSHGHAKVMEEKAATPQSK